MLSLMEGKRVEGVKHSKQHHDVKKKLEQVHPVLLGKLQTEFKEIHSRKTNQ